MHNQKLLKSFAKLPQTLEIPDLIQVQLNSFRWFQEEGLRELFEEISPIQDYTGTRLELHFVDYEFREPLHSIPECLERGLTYSSPIHVTARLVVKETGEIKQQELYFSDFPLMRDGGTFIISGVERVVVNQLTRFPGVYFTLERDPSSGRELCVAKLVAEHGAQMGLYIQLIVAFASILARAEMFASKNKIMPSMFDGIGMGLGFLFALSIISLFRELLGKGSLWGYQIIHAKPLLILILPAGGFFAVGLLMGFFNWISMRGDKNGRV